MRTSQKTALIAGATGLVGEMLLQQLLADERYAKIKLLLRRPLAQTHDKLEQRVIDFDALQTTDLKSFLADTDEFYCALGTTRKKAGSKEAFRKVDYDYVVNLARKAAQAGIPKVALVSAMGADKKSFFFYNQVKGEVEYEISHLDFELVYIARPSLLLGARQEERTGEDLAKVFDSLLNPIIPQKYKGIEAKKVAASMVSVLNSSKEGLIIIESDDLQTY
ncbi:oxidoreductase [Hugenholtzia roseola]|uniref:oxidoreductase n=1 Tax=Hugenholtzia roseola TaxID=1002 RepID=UPI00041CC7CD|nr:oxidoreductase [Hugenholtzia roseola]